MNFTELNEKRANCSANASAKVFAAVAKEFSFMRDHGDILFGTFAKKPLAIRRVASPEDSCPKRSIALSSWKIEAPGEFQISIEIPDLESGNVPGYIFL